MTRLILDHYRRWGWVLVLCAALEFGLGWFIASNSKFTFEFWAFLLAMWTGPMLLSFDFKRGALRPVAVLPLTGDQMGRTWWMATVPIPAIALAALLFSGAVACYHVHPENAFPTERLVLAIFFTLVWLGTQFAMIFNATRGFGRNLREFICNSLVSWLTILMFFGSMVFCLDASRSLLRTGILLGVGALLSVVGWVRAEQFDPGRAGIYLGRIEPPNLRGSGLRLTPLELKIPPGHYQVPVGYGGIPFLLRTTFIRAFMYLAAMVALMALTGKWQSQTLVMSPNLVLWAMMGSFMSCWFVLLYQFMPLLQQLRYLRTLPISASSLAAVMLGVAILPLVALGALTAGVAGPTLGYSAAITVSASFIFILAPAALCVFFAIWTGAGKLAYALVLFTLMGFLMAGIWLQTLFHHSEITFPLAGSIAAISILLAFLLTRCALRRSSLTYRVQANCSGNLPWGR